MATLKDDSIARATPANDNGDSLSESMNEKASPATAAAEKPPREISGIKWTIVVFAILSSTFLFALDNTVVADVQAQIVQQFDSVAQIAWLSVAFIMAAVSTNLFFGQLYSQFPAKYLYIASSVVFEVGSALCGAAPSMASLIVGRALAGLGGIGMYLGVMSLLTATTTIQERPLYVGGIGLTWGLGTILGPVVGGALADSKATWRWAFYINLVIFALAAPVYLFLLPKSDPRPEPFTTLRSRLSHIDWVGAPLMLGAIVSFTMGINFGGILYEWNSASEIALFVVAGVLFIAFALQQAFCIGVAKDDRIFPVQLISRHSKDARTVLIMFCCTAAGGCAIFLPVFFIPLFFQFTRGDTATQAAVRLLPFILVMVVVTLTMGAILGIPGCGYYMPWYLVGGILATVGGALMFTVKSDTSVAAVYGYSALVGAGTGTFSQAGFSIAQASVDPAHGHVAAAFIALAQTGGITISLAIANSLFVNRAEDGIMAILPGVPKELVQGLIAGVVNKDLVGSLSPEVQKEVLDVVVDAISRPYILLVTAGALVVVLSLVMKRGQLFIAPAAIGS